MVTMQHIEAVSEHIARAFRPERIILFGSYARGTATDSSDVDLLVILPFEGRVFRKSIEILKRVDPPFALDLVVRRPDDTERRYAEYDPLIREALDGGRVLYERDG